MRKSLFCAPLLLITGLFGCSGKSTSDSGIFAGNTQGTGSSGSGIGTGGNGPGTGPMLRLDDGLLGGGGVGTGGGGGPCQGLACQQKACTGLPTTSVSGRVFDPSGQLPLYNVMVYVPNAPLAPLTPGATCKCEVSGEPIASAITDTDGRFTMPNVPVGADIPLVIQVGKWRRKFTLPSVAECTNTAIPESMLRLPARQSEGDMPKIALTTGGADALECLIPKLGIDPAEFTNPDGTGKINYFTGHGGTDQYAQNRNAGVNFPPASQLWNSVDTLKAYDVALLSCEGGKNANEKGPAAFKAMQDYANLGGRVFASHWHEVWFTDGPAPFPDVATFVKEPDIGNITADVTTSFPKGQALAEWLVNVKASTTLGLIDITAAQHTVMAENPMYAQRWISSKNPQSVQYLSANTPMGAAPAAQCGRVVLSDIHVSGGTDANNPNVDKSGSNLRFPEGCVTTGLSPQEKVLAFMLFDITACVIPDTAKPVAPPVIIR